MNPLLIAPISLMLFVVGVFILREYRKSNTPKAKFRRELKQLKRSILKLGVNINSLEARYIVTRDPELASAIDTLREHLGEFKRRYSLAEGIFQTVYGENP